MKCKPKAEMQNPDPALFLSTILILLTIKRNHIRANRLVVPITPAGNCCVYNFTYLTNFFVKCSHGIKERFFKGARLQEISTQTSCGDFVLALLLEEDSGL